MAWSIFDYQNGDAVATAWAVELLSALNVQATPASLQFVFDWEKSEGGGGAFNPLNQGPVPNDPSLTTTGQQYGGGAADFASWEAGIQGAVAYLNMPNFQPVLQAMQSGDYNAMTQALWQSPWAASHYGYGADWATSAYTQMSPDQIASTASNVGMSGNVASVANAGFMQSQNATGGTVTQPASNTLNGQPLSMGDVPQVVQWIKQNWASYAWLLNEPGVAAVLEQAAVQGLSTDQVQAKVEQTTWWRDTSSAMRQFEQDMVTNPADYQFGTGGSKAQSMYSQVANVAGQQGVLLNTQQIQQISMDALRFGWSSAQIQQAIGSQVTFYGNNRTNAGGIAQQLQQQAGQYLMPLTSQVIDSWAQNIAAGTQNIQQFDAYMKQNASLKWTGMAQQIAQGYTPNQIVDNLRQEAAKTMEVDPNSIDFVNNPFYSRVLDYVPPNADVGGKAVAQPHRIMTLSEMDQYLKQSPQYGYTQGARDSAGQLEQAIAQTFGKTG